MNIAASSISDHPPGKRRRTLAAPSEAILYLLIASVIGLPMVTNFFRISSSVSFGTTLAALTFIGLQLLHGAETRLAKQAPFFALLISMGVALHLGLAATYGPVDLLRGLGSVPVLAICVMGAAAAADLLSRARPVQLRRVLHRCTQALLIIGLWGGLGLPEPSFGGWNKPIFPFTEPSHFAVTIGPYLLFTCVTCRTITRVAYICTAVLVTALLQSTTLAAIVIVTTLLCLRLRYALIACALLAPVIASLDLTYYLARLDFSEETSNLTSLVYLQGWQLIGEAWETSSGIGIGFQQLGVFGTEVPAAQLIAAVLGSPDAVLNLFDGGFTLAKLLCEFGIFGAAALVTFAPVIWRATASLHRHAALARPSEPALLIACAFIVGSVFELALRGIGYFTPTGIMVFASLWIWWKRRARATFA
jgi:hypothetical protein